MVKWCWRKALGLRSPHVTLPTEIAPGVVRPSYALAGMLANCSDNRKRLKKGKK